MIIENKKAWFDYEVLETITCGIILQGWEVKAIDAGKTSLTSSFCDIDKSGLILLNTQITPNLEHNYVNEGDDKRIKRLLVNSWEIGTMKQHLQVKGNTLIPLKIFRNDKGKYKVLIGLCKGKKNYDKRESIKKKDIERDLKRNV